MLVANLLPLMACSFIAAEMMDIAPAFDFLTLALAVQVVGTAARSSPRFAKKAPTKKSAGKGKAGKAKAAAAKAGNDTGEEGSPQLTDKERVLAWIASAHSGSEGGRVQRTSRGSGAA